MRLVKSPPSTLIRMRVSSSNLMLKWKQGSTLEPTAKCDKLTTLAPLFHRAVSTQPWMMWKRGHHCGRVGLRLKNVWGPDRMLKQ